MREHYRIISDFSRVDLQHRVNSAIEKGWKPQGGVTCLHVPGLNHSASVKSLDRASGTTYWSQAIVWGDEKSSPADPG